ncbi:hypothetical protein RS85_02592 [Microbacterium sp. SA39]|nr:hypothetical protein RS85_02592 [Microbacterium sp. SA39]
MRERYAATITRERASGATGIRQAYDRRMTKTQQDSTEQDASLAPLPLADGLNLLEADAAGYCSGGVCHIPATKTQ